MKSMNPFLLTTACHALCLLGTAGLVRAQEETADWPQWRGRANDSLSTEQGWANEGTALWSMEVGLGYSSVAVTGGRLYTAGYDEEAGLDVIWCLDALSGEELWAHAFESAIWNEYHTGGTLGTPTVSGDTVYALNREGNLHCLDAESGEVRWQRALKKELDLEYPTWGFAASPLVLDEELIINVGKVLSLSKKSGKTRWVSKDFGHAYSTPTPVEFADRSALAVFNGDGLALLERSRGETLAFHPFKTKYDVNAASPIIVGDKIFISAGYEHGCALLAMEPEGLEVLWESKHMGNEMSGCVFIDGHFYGFDNAVLTALDLEGNVAWKERGLGKGALVGTTERLIVMSGRGELIIADASPDGFQPLSKAAVVSGGKCWTKPVLAGGLIYCRNSEGELVCRDHRGES